MSYETEFPRTASDLFGYVTPWVALQTVNEYLAKEWDLDGVSIVRLLKELGATWMLGQLLVEQFEPVRHSVPMEVRCDLRKTCGVTCLRQASIFREDRELLRYTGKFLPVDARARKKLPLSVLEPLWLRPDGGTAKGFDWVRPPEHMELAEELTVRHWWCDPNEHMTTYQYVNLVCELAGYWTGPVRVLERMQIDFRAEFVPGERMLLYRGTENGVTYISGFHGDGRLGFSAGVKLSEREYPYGKVQIETLIGDK